MLRKKIRRLENSHPSVALHNFSIKWTVPYPDVGLLLPSQVAGSFSRIKRKLDLQIVVLEIEIETLRNLPSVE